MVRVKLLVFALAERKLRLLLRRDGAANLRGIGLPGTVLKPGESPEKAAASCLRRLWTSARTYREQLYTFGGNGAHGVSATISYLVLARDVRGLRRAVAWHSLDPLPRLRPTERRIVDYGLTRLRNKIGYAHLAFHFLPRRFSLPELQRVYETVLGCALDKRNFRKRVRSLYALAPAGMRSEGRRPARLYEFAGTADRGRGLL